MHKIIFVFLLIFSKYFCFGQEAKIKKILNDIYREHPAILAELYFNPNKDYEKTAKIKKSEYLLPSVIESFAIKEGKLYHHNLSKILNSKVKQDKDHRKKITTHPQMMYHWEFEIKEKGEYIIFQPSNNGVSGFLNDQNVHNIHHNTISISFSGSNFITLDTGKHNLYLLKLAHTKALLKVINRNKLYDFSNVIYKKITSTKKEDQLWIEKYFYPSLSSKSSGISNYLIELFELDFFKSKFKKNKNKSIVLFIEILKRVKGYDFYQMEDYFYTNYKDYYFYHLPNKKTHSSLLNNIYYGTGYRYDLITNYIYTNQPKKAEKFIKEFLDYIKETNSKSFDQIHAIIHVQLWLANFYTGYLRKCNQLTEKYKATFKKFTSKARNSISTYNTIKSYVGVDPKPASKLFIADSTEKMAALRIKDLIKSYQGDQGELKKAFELFTELKYRLIDFGNDFHSLNNIFASAAYSNKLFLNDFLKYSKKSLQSKIKTALLKNDVNQMKSIIKKFGDLLPLNELQNALLNYYFLRGDFHKAHYYAKLIYNHIPEKRKLILSKLKTLEKINHTLEEDQITLVNVSNNHNINHKGNKVNISTIFQKKKKSINTAGPGTLIKRISLPKIHNQYTNHPVIDFHQGADVTFTSSTLYITTASSIQALDLKTNKIRWSSFSKNEYYNESEKGPHQKRFISRKVGDSIIYFTNQEHSALKTVKCYDIEGQLRWDLSAQSNIFISPITTPIQAGDSLYSLSYNGSGTFKSINFDILNPLNGNLIKSIPLAMIDNLQHDTYGGRINHPWNTYRHDNHFAKDEKAIYGFTGTGITFKASIKTKELLWGKAFNKPNRSKRYYFNKAIASAPSGFIKLFKDILVTFTPENQSFIGINKQSGNLIWRSLMYKPQFIHSRFSNKFIYISNHNSGAEPKVIKIDSQNGEMIWERSLNGLAPKGEGQLHNGKIYIPCSKSIVVLSGSNGDILEVKKMNLQPLKLRYSKGYWVLFTSNDAYLLKADDSLNNSTFIPSPYPETGFVKPEQQTIDLPYSTIVLEKSLYLPEKTYSTSDSWSKNKLIETSLLYHHIMKMNGHITLFREGFEKKDKTYIAPTIMWYEEIPYHFLTTDKIFVSVPGEVRLEDLFTRNVIWSHHYQSKPYIYKKEILKSKPIIAASRTHVAVQTINQSILILDTKTGKRLLTFSAPKAKAIAICKNYVVISAGTRLYCYDINQHGKQIWSQYNTQRYELRQEEDKIFLLHYNNGYAYKVYDLPTGKFAYTLKSPGRSYNKAYKEVHHKFGKDYSFAYYHLYDGKTGNLIKEYGEVHQARNGGYFCFDKLYGNTGVYKEKGKSYKFKTIRGREHNNPEIGILKKGNKIIVQAVFFIETFEIKGDKLVSIHYIQNNAAKYGNHANQRGLILYPLDNSLFEVRGSQMFFFRNFDPHHHYEKLESFRVSNHSNSQWPHSELYPEKIVQSDQWVPNNNSKPLRTFQYLAFGDKKFAYLKFTISPLKNKSYSHKLFISTNSAIGQGIVQWNPDEWKTCSTNFIFKGRVQSWKEMDMDGNINLFLKFTYKDTYDKYAKNKLPDFSIELRQYKKGIDDGCFRMGGAFYYGPKFFPWNTKENNESQQIKNFNLRNNIYQNGNFYPQGNELYKWFYDRRKLYTVKDNIRLLKEMVKKNKSNYCVINILATLLMEEIQNIRELNPDLLEIDPSFQKQIQPLLLKTATFANQLKIKNEWTQYALQIWAIEIFPRKLMSEKQSISVHNFSAYGKKRSVYAKGSTRKLTSNINIPHLEFLTPGLIAGYPIENQLRKIILQLGLNNTYIGNLHQYSPNKTTLIINRSGKLMDSAIKKSHNLKASIYNFNNKSYSVNQLIKVKRAIENFTIEIPAIKIPLDKSYSGLNFESVINSLKNLPTDSNLSSTLINGIIRIKKNLTIEKINELYVAWLTRIKSNHKATVKACRYIYKSKSKSKNVWDDCKAIFKKAKVNKNIQRSFLLNQSNQFGFVDNRSILGPIVDDLDKNPEDQENPDIEYESLKEKYSFKKDVVKLKKKSKAKFIYVAIKLTVPKRKKIYFISNVHEDYYNRASESISLWVNGKKKIDLTSYREHDDHLISKKLSLKKGANIVLIKFDFSNRWNFLRYRFGDLRGFTIKDLKIERIHKPAKPIKKVKPNK
ncbi:MAG: hypothetical protein COA79_05045 [Planctomycetota bacterium]|nr:MAG: hypothetical protein COA79_05045 [Planctomycetota bacterium]